MGRSSCVGGITDGERREMSGGRNRVGCSFCAAVARGRVFADSGKFVAIYNIAPILPGHSLVVPKAHVESLMDLSDSEVSEFVLFSRDVAKVLMRAFETRSFDWTIQEGEEAGQTVSHLHMHIIPRKEGDMPHPGDWYPQLLRSKSENIDSESRPKLNSGQMKSVVRHLREIAAEVGLRH
jgi:bis(5'-adenosyl)-triphosphatase